MLRFIVLWAVAVLPACAVTGEDAPGTAQALGSPGGTVNVSPETETRQWLKLQTSGKLAGSRYTMPGKVATLAYRRYLYSYRYPIPRQFYFGSQGSGGSSSGTGGASSGMGLSGGGGATAGR